MGAGASHRQVAVLSRGKQGIEAAKYPLIRTIQTDHCFDVQPLHPLMCWLARLPPVPFSPPVPLTSFPSCPPMQPVTMLIYYHDYMKTTGGL